MPIDRKYIDGLIGQRVRIEHVNGGRHTGVITEGGDNACFTLRKDGMPDTANGYLFNLVDIESVTRVYDLRRRGEDHDGHTINIGQVTVGEPLPKHDQPIDTEDILTMKVLRDEILRLQGENAKLAAIVNELAMLYEDHTGAVPVISTGEVVADRG